MAAPNLQGQGYGGSSAFTSTMSEIAPTMSGGPIAATLVIEGGMTIGGSNAIKVKRMRVTGKSSLSRADTKNFHSGRRSRRFKSFHPDHYFPGVFSPEHAEIGAAVPGKNSSRFQMRFQFEPTRFAPLNLAEGGASGTTA